MGRTGMSLKRVFTSVVGPVVDVIVPQGCWAGGQGEVALGLSLDAREEIGTLAAQRYCFHCGLSAGPFEKHDVSNPCGRCGERDAGVVRMSRVGTFSEPLVTLVHRLKFGRAWEVAAVLAPFLYQATLRVAEESGVPVDALMPVPLHWRRKAQRGFNQAEELARALHELSGWPVAHALRRTRPTLEQALTESASKRADNLRGAFSCSTGAGGRVAGKHIWLMDDVTTTGATLHAAANAIRKLHRDERPASINAVVVCVTDLRSPPAPTPA